MLDKQADFPIEVNVYNFIGNKTGMFGMTRMDKSDTMKTVAARVFTVLEQRHAAGMPSVGQLVFYPQASMLTRMPRMAPNWPRSGIEHVVIYRFGADRSQTNVRPLGFNFFNSTQIEAVRGIISSALAGAG